MCVRDRMLMDGVSLVGLPQFNRKYGELLKDGSGEYQIPAPWQAGLSNVSEDHVPSLDRPQKGDVTAVDEQ